MAGCEDIRPQLSDFVDGALVPAARAAVDAHLATCAACAGLTQDLARLRDTARQLGPVTPPDHLWIEIAGRVHLDQPTAGAATAAGEPRRHAAWQWMGLAAALVVITAGAYLFDRLARSDGSPSAPVVTGPGNAAATGSVEGFERELKQAEEHYDKAIAELEAITKNNDGSLDPEVAAMLKKNLTTIDGAITESREALNTHPESEPARDSLFEALRRKVGVLQATVVLMNEMRKGNQEGAARVAAGIGKKS